MVSKITSDILAATTLISILSIVLETVPALSSYMQVFLIIEWVTVIIFTLEYIGRCMATKRPLSYVFSFFGIVDVLAILPTYIGLGNLTFLKAARSIRIIRFLRILRLAKLARLPKKGGGSKVWILNLEIYAIAILTMAVIIGTLFFIFENNLAPHIPSGMYWAFILFVGGIPHTAPETDAGVAILVVARFASMVFFGMLIGLMGTIMRKLLIGSEKD